MEWWRKGGVDDTIVPALKRYTLGRGLRGAAGGLLGLGGPRGGARRAGF